MRQVNAHTYLRERREKKADPLKCQERRRKKERADGKKKVNLSKENRAGARIEKKSYRLPLYTLWQVLVFLASLTFDETFHSPPELSDCVCLFDGTFCSIRLTCHPRAHPHLACAPAKWALPLDRSPWDCGQVDSRSHGQSQCTGKEARNIAVTDEAWVNPCFSRERAEKKKKEKKISS